MRQEQPKGQSQRHRKGQRFEELRQSCKNHEGPSQNRRNAERDLPASAQLPLQDKPKGAPCKNKGRRFLQTTKATEGNVFLGFFEHLLIAMFGGVDLVVDPYTNAASAKIGITSHMMADVNVRHPQAFNVVSLTV